MLPKKCLYILMAVLLLFTCCHPSETAMGDLEKFTIRMEEQSSTWSAADWDDAAIHYSEICQTIERYDYDAQQKRYIGELKGRCMAQFYKHSLREATQGMQDAFIELGGAIEGLIEGLGK